VLTTSNASCAICWPPVTGSGPSGYTLASGAKSSIREVRVRRSHAARTRCDGSRGPVTCGSEEITRQAKTTVEREKKAVEDLKDKKRKLEDDRSRASTDDEKAKITGTSSRPRKRSTRPETASSKPENDLEARKKLVDDEIYTSTSASPTGEP
jgi:hypothetical protein